MSLSTQHKSDIHFKSDYQRQRISSKTTRYSQVASVTAHEIRKVEPAALEPDTRMSRRNGPGTYHTDDNNDLPKENSAHNSCHTRNTHQLYIHQAMDREIISPVVEDHVALSRSAHYQLLRTRGASTVHDTIEA